MQTTHTYSEELTVIPAINCPCSECEEEGNWSASDRRQALTAAGLVQDLAGNWAAPIPARIYLIDPLWSTQRCVAVIDVPAGSIPEEVLESWMDAQPAQDIEGKEYSCLIIDRS